ncbi:MAG: class I SAM-dependent methyltransferase [Rhizobiaceae bacterium]
MTTQSGLLAPETHARAMDRIYRWQRHFYNPTRKFYLIGRDEMIASLGAQPAAHVLELGCGTGRNLAVAARYFPQSTFYGVDISAQMLTSARHMAQREKLNHGTSIVTAQGDASSFDAAARFGVEGFDRIMLSYCLSMIPDWRVAVENAIRQTAPGGSIHIVDFGHMGRWPYWMRWSMRKWLSSFKVSPCRDLVGVAERLADEAGFSSRSECLMGGYAWHVVLQKPVDPKPFEISESVEGLPEVTA